MLKKCAILGLTLLLVGGLALAWVRSQIRKEQHEANASALKHSLQPEEYLDSYGRWYELTPEQRDQLVLNLDKDQQDKTQDQLADEQQARLRRDIDRLAAGDIGAGDIADFLYGANWEEKVTRYKKQKEHEQIAQTASTVCLSIGGTLFAACVLIWVLESITGAFRSLAGRRSQSEATGPQETELTDIPHEEPPPEQGNVESQLHQRQRKKLPAETAQQLSAVTARDGNEQHVMPYRLRHDVPSGNPSTEMETAIEQDPVAVLLSDEPVPDAGWTPQTQWAARNLSDEAGVLPPQRRRLAIRPQIAVLDTEEVGEKPDHTLEERADDLQKQIAQFKQGAQRKDQDQAEPINATLRELTQQVSAIRDYAACQQDRVEKLQDGYDWTIIRTFCLRVIRCIDNVESRIGKLASGNGSVTQLEEVRDELLFALESSGVEQFRPEIGGEFRGQEKFAEAVKEKQPAKKTDQAGKIARVIRPGYRYVADDDCYKVVRTAQVKLFG